MGNRVRRTRKALHRLISRARDERREEIPGQRRERRQRNPREEEKPTDLHEMIVRELGRVIRKMHADMVRRTIPLGPVDEAQQKPRRQGDAPRRDDREAKADALEPAVSRSHSQSP